jgi:hypothetical protein
MEYINKHGFKCNETVNVTGDTLKLFSDIAIKSKLTGIITAQIFGPLIDFESSDTLHIKVFVDDKCFGMAAVIFSDLEKIK